MNKFYAFYNFETSESGIVSTWQECEQKVKNVSSIQYKKFRSLQDAKSYIEQFKNIAEEVTDKDDLIHFYVDGSYRHGKSAKASWAWVAIHQNNKVAEDSGVTSGNALSRNIDGEISATLKALDWFFHKKHYQQFSKYLQQKIVICYDYAGIEYWAKGVWSAKTEISISYQKNVKNYTKNILFQKIKSHSNDLWNDYVDLLAKEQLS